MPGNNLPSLLDRLRVEIEESPDRSDFTATSWIRHRLLRGETLTREGVMDAYGVSRGLLDQTVKVLHGCGWDLEWSTVDEEGTRGVRIVDLHPIDEKAVEAYMGEVAAKVAAKAAEKAEREAKEEKAKEARTRARQSGEAKKREVVSAMAVVGGERVAAMIGGETGGPRSSRNFADYPIEAAPSIDDNLSVYLLARNVDGTMTIGLRNGSRAWVATLTGMTAVDR